jgi:mono/diheme cytochrome c family protein
MKKLNQTIIVFIATVTFGSCTNAIINDEEVVPINNEVKYNPNVNAIMFNNCVTCHGGGAPSAGLDLTTYSTVRNATENGNLLNRINNGANPMPSAGLMNVQDRATIQKWKDDGYSEN